MRLYLFLLLLLVLIPQTADARSIQLVFPVEISNLPPDVHTAKITCTLEGPESRRMGQTDIYLPLVDGGFSGQVRARVIPSGYPSSVDPVPDARAFDCTMVFNWACTSGTGDLGRCEYRPWDASLAEGPAGALFRTDPASSPNWEFRVEFDPATAENLPRRLR